MKFILPILIFLFFSIEASAQECLGLHRTVASLQGGSKVCLTQIEEDAVRAEWAVWDTALPERMKDRALAEARIRMKPRGRLLVATNTHIAEVQAALNRLVGEIDTATLADLKTLNVRTWAGWPQ